MHARQTTAPNPQVDHGWLGDSPLGVVVMAPKDAMLPFNSLGGTACLPVVLTRLLRLSDADATPAALEALVGIDPALCMQLLELYPLRDAAQHLTIPQLLRHSGVQGLQAVAVPAALQRARVVAPTALADQIWQRCLSTALLARQLARQLGIGNPDETYLAALLLRCGHWLMALNGGEEYAALLCVAAGDEARQLELERQRYGTTRLQVSAALLRGTPLPLAAKDALRYHSHAVEPLCDVHPLTRILLLADRLALYGADGIATAAAAFWFQLDAVALTTLIRQGGQEMQALLLPLGLSPSAINGGAETALQEALANRVLHPAMESPSPWRTLRITLSLRFGLSTLLLLRHDATSDSLQAVDSESPLALADFRLRCTPGNSLAAEAFRHRLTRHSFDDEEPCRSVADEQLTRMLGKPGLCCLPFAAGVVVLGLHADEWQALHPRLSAIQALLEATGRACPIAPPAERATPTAVLQQRIRETRHEIAAPLTALRNYLHLVEGKSTDASEELRIMRSELTRIGRILDRLGSAEVRAESGPVDLNQLLHDVLDGLQLPALAAQQGVALCTELHPALPVLRSDAVALKQILTNLIHNALEAMPQGGRLRLGTALHPGGDGHPRWVLTVADTGPGIAPATLDQLFLPKSSSKPGHAGLGLCIVKRLVDELGGTIDCQSLPQIGTCFVVWLSQTAAPQAFN